MDKQNWPEDTAKKIRCKLREVAGRNQETIPYRSIRGSYEDLSQKDIFWWTNGFWGGILWQMYHATGDRLYRRMAEGLEQKLEQNLLSYRGLDHDSGFKWMLTAVASYRLTGNARSRDRALVAANSLAGRFNPAGRFLRAWNDDGSGEKAGWAIIDCMMNLPLLYWAAGELRDPRFLHIAQAHADTTMRTFIREDGSARHIVEFQPETGEPLGSLGGQGYGRGSSWTRGQAWAIYGFVLSYLHTGKNGYLDTAQNAADYFLANMPESGRIPSDFKQPPDCAWEDGSAAAIAACGLLELAKLTPGPKASLFRQAAGKLLCALSEDACWDPARDHIVENCTVAFHGEEHNLPLVYADYFFLEAIWKLCGDECFLW